MKFLVNGADQETGETVEFIVNAPDEDAAREYAGRKGILVSSVAAFPSEQSMAPVGSHPPAPAVPPRFRPEQGHQPNAPVVNVATPRRGNSLGVAALILGILAFLICWIPFLNLIGLPLAGLGLILAAIGFVVALTRRGASIGFPIAGLAINALALVVTISLTSAIVTGFSSAADEMARAAAEGAASNQSGVTEAGGPTGDVDWALASSPVRQGDVQLTIDRVAVTGIPLIDRTSRETRRSDERYLLIEFSIANLSQTRKLGYSSWREETYGLLDSASLTDNHENSYSLVSFGMFNEPQGGTDSATLHPGETVTDVLIFERPLDNIDEMRLELPAGAFDGTGWLRLRIPASMINR